MDLTPEHLPPVGRRLLQRGPQGRDIRPLGTGTAQVDLQPGNLALLLADEWCYGVGWDANGEAPKGYTSGTWGPAASSALVGRDGCAWHEED